MGGDGGSLPHRADMVKTKGYKFAYNLGGMGYIPNTFMKDSSNAPMPEHARRALTLTTCALTQEILHHPIVGCGHGCLYNREAVLSALLSKTMPTHAAHITSLNDVRIVNVTINADTGFLVCPVTKRDIEGYGRVILLWTCGCIMSEKGIKIVKKSHQDMPSNSSGKSPAICLNCSMPYDSEADTVYLAPSTSDFERMKATAKARQKLRKSLKLKKKCVAIPLKASSAEIFHLKQHNRKRKLESFECVNYDDDDMPKLPRFK